MGAAPGPSGGSPRRETTAVPAALESRSLDELKARAQIAVRLTWLMLFRAVVTTVLLATALILRATSVEPMFERAAVVLYAVAGVSYGAWPARCGCVSSAIAASSDWPTRSCSSTPRS